MNEVLFVRAFCFTRTKAALHQLYKARFLSTVALFSTSRKDALFDERGKDKTRQRHAYYDNAITLPSDISIDYDDQLTSEITFVNIPLGHHITHKVNHKICSTLYHMGRKGKFNTIPNHLTGSQPNQSPNHKTTTVT